MHQVSTFILRIVYGRSVNRTTRVGVILSLLRVNTRWNGKKNNIIKIDLTKRIRRKKTHAECVDSRNGNWVVRVRRLGREGIDVFTAPSRHLIRVRHCVCVYVLYNVNRWRYRIREPFVRLSSRRRDDDDDNDGHQTVLPCTLAKTRQNQHIIYYDNMNHRLIVQDGDGFNAPSNGRSRDRYAWRGQPAKYTCSRANSVV